MRRALFPEAGRASDADALATPPKIDAGGYTQAASGLQAGELVGPYRLIHPLGAGGMAEVWLAQRADGAFKREVALKLPALARLRKDLASRFVRERDILAALEHPNIARLYDAGVSAEGLPYLAMECVHGQPLTAWCDGHQAGVRERLKLFLQVLDAVQYAHGCHVLHRDIKPSNILVTDSGQVRLLDFGVAKLLAEEEEHTQLTQIYGQALTPEYASPELLRGETLLSRSGETSGAVNARPFMLDPRGRFLGVLPRSAPMLTLRHPCAPFRRTIPACSPRSSFAPEELARYLLKIVMENQQQGRFHPRTFFTALSGVSSPAQSRAFSRGSRLGFRGLCGDGCGRRDPSGGGITPRGGRLLFPAGQPFRVGDRFVFHREDRCEFFQTLGPEPNTPRSDNDGGVRRKLRMLAQVVGLRLGNLPLPCPVDDTPHRAPGI
jgi:tRNA A-37 threonylcarbamoyl transferase component Bud32